jgi:kynureninase
MHNIDTLALKLQPHYSHFDVSNRLLFSGHSHQAWPDVALEGLQEGFLEAAKYVDEKWSHAFKKSDVLRAYLRRFYDDPDGRYTVSQNTHDVLVRLLSSFDWTNGRIVTTDGEFHTVFRQMKRLEDVGVKVDRVPVFPLKGIAERFAEALKQHATVVIVSRVFFMNALVLDELPAIARLCKEKNIPLIVDDYHGTNVIPISLREMDMTDTYWLIGGYKYLQWGEGNCFLRFPKNCSLKPVITGWFSTFGSLTLDRDKVGIQFDEGDNLFLGGTYDPISQYRAAKVVAFFDEMGITPDGLERQYRTQIQMVRDTFKALHFPEQKLRLQHDVSATATGGFVALESPKAGEIRVKLREQGMFTDHRGNILRIGVAPYLSSSQIDAAMHLLRKVVDMV